MYPILASILAGLTVLLVLWLRRGNRTEALARTGVAVEAAIAALIVLHLAGYHLSGFSVLLVLGVVGNLASLKR